MRKCIDPNQALYIASVWTLSSLAFIRVFSSSTSPETIDLRRALLAVKKIDKPTFPLSYSLGQ